MLQIPLWKLSKLQTLFKVYYGTGERKLRRRKRIKQQTLIERKKQNQNIYLN
jgi:hypothetical protein